MRNRLFISILFLFLTNCVSVQLPGGKSQPAEGVQFTSPDAPFISIQAPQIDKSWQSQKTGNTISYFSTCGATTDPTLEILERDALNALNDLQVQSSQELTFNGRAARQALALGQIDGVPVQLKVLVFKKNNCNYTLTYGGVESKFNSEVAAFDKFSQSFQAP